MLITVNCIKCGGDATGSTLSVDNRVVCFGLQDELRENKVVDSDL